MHRVAPIRLALLVAVAAIATVASPPAAASAGEERAEQRALGFVRAVAGGDPDVAWAFVEANFAPAALERRGEAAWRRSLQRLAADLAGMEPEGILLDDGKLTIVARGDDHAATLVFRWEAEPPHRLTMLSVEPRDATASGVEAPELPDGASDAEIARVLEGWLGGLAAAGDLSGAVLVARDGEPLLRGARGLADRGWGIPNRVETRFDLGSIQKIFTQAAVARLVDEGRLSLDATVAELLPEYPNRETAQKITVRQLVEHSSGLGDIFTDEYRDAAKTRFRRPEDFFPLFAHEPLLFAPGSSRSYSNAGYQVLGAVVAAVAGEPFHEHVARHVFAAAGMTRTAFVARDEPTPDVAVGYTAQTPDSSLRNNLYRLPVVGSPAGSSFSTVDDLLAFVAALRAGDLLPEPWALWLWGGPEPGSGESADFGLADLEAGVGGGAPGVSAVLELSGPWTVVVLANQDPPVAERVGGAIVEALRGSR